MKLPTFKRRLTFAGDVKAPCLRAVLPNSVVPGLAAKHAAKHAEDPVFEIFLRGGKAPAKITAWQTKMLTRLLEAGGLGAAVEEGVREYYEKQRHDEYADYERTARQDMKRNGVLPHFVLSEVILDDARREAILALNTTSDGNLEEHGAVIYLKGKRWRFAPERLDDYLQEVAEEERARGRIDFEEESDEAEPDAGPAAGSIDVVYGAWEYDPDAHQKWLTANGERANDIRLTMDMYKGGRFEFSEKRMLSWNKYRPLRKPDEDNEILGIEMQGARVTITFRVGKLRRESIAFVYENDRLRNPHGGIYKRATREPA